MLNPKIGDTLARITPPSLGREGYAQTGEVIHVSESTVVLTVLADIPRRMEFSRQTGYDLVGLGTFIVRI